MNSLLIIHLISKENVKKQLAGKLDEKVGYHEKLMNIVCLYVVKEPHYSHPSESHPTILSLFNQLFNLIPHFTAVTLTERSFTHRFPLCFDFLCVSREVSDDL